MARPDLTAQREPEQRLVTTWSPVAVRSALTQMQRGDFGPAGALADAVLADDRVQAALGTRVNGVLGLPLKFDPADDTTAAAKAAQALDADWWEIANETVLSEWTAYALLLGACAAELVWDTTGERAVPRLRVWHPSNLRRDPGTGGWSVQLQGGKRLPIEPGDGKWALLTPFGERRGGTRGLLRSLAIAWLSKSFAIGDWNRYSEVHGSAARVGRSPKGATISERELFRDDLARLASDSSIIVPDGWTVELLEAKVGSGEVFEKLISWADKAIAISVLGQNLTTDVEGGSLAAAEVHERVRYDLVQNDAEVIATTAHDHLVSWWSLYNFGARELAPWPAWDTAAPTDEVASATALGQRAQALLTLSTVQQQTGLPVDWSELADQLSIPLVRGQAVVTPPQLAVRLASGDDPSSTRGFVRGQLYADRLADAGRMQAGQALAPALEDVLKLVTASRGYDDLRARLLAAYSDLSIDDLADLTESTVLLASLAGRLAVLDDSESN